jgi:hypothetical protein
VTLGIQAKEINLGFIRPENLVCLLGAFWQTPSWLSCAFFNERLLPSGLYHKGLIGGVL